jgi:hypothetical protein
MCVLGYIHTCDYTARVDKVYCKKFVAYME